MPFSSFAPALQRVCALHLTDLNEICVLSAKHHLSSPNQPVASPKAPSKAHSHSGFTSCYTSKMDTVFFLFRFKSKGEILFGVAFFCQTKGDGYKTFPRKINHIDPLKIFLSVAQKERSRLHSIRLSVIKHLTRSNKSNFTMTATATEFKLSKDGYRVCSIKTLQIVIKADRDCFENHKHDAQLNCRVHSLAHLQEAVNMF